MSVLWPNVSANCQCSCLLCLFVILVVTSFIYCRTAWVESLDLMSSRDLIFSKISDGTGYDMNRCHTEGMWCDVALRLMASRFLSAGRKPSFAHLVFNLPTVSSPVCPFQVDAGTMLYRVDSDVHRQTIVTCGC